MKKILAIATNRFEDVELLGFIDVVKRHGILVDVAFDVKTDHVTSQVGHQIKVVKRVKDVIDKLDTYDGMFLPGGAGFEDLSRLEGLEDIINHFIEEDKVVGAICAAPTILAAFGFLKGKNAIVFDDKDLKQYMEDHGAILPKYLTTETSGQDWEVVSDGNIITGHGMRTTIKFADEYVKLLRTK